MILSLDYDETYTLDPVFWDDFISYAKLRGHKVYCVTWRTPAEGLEVLNSVGKQVGHPNVIFASRNAKRDFCVNLGIFIDVWIDDMPHAVDSGYGGR
jgi:hypothetical protein